MNSKELNEKFKERVVEAFIGEDLMPFVERNLGIDWCKIFEGEITPYVRNLIDQSYYFDFQRRDRTEFLFIKELIFSRCIELKLIESNFFRLTLNGSDKHCLITQISTMAPDLLEINTSNYIEVISTYSGSFILKELLYVPKAKFENLTENAKTKKQFILAVDVLHKCYCFVPILEDIEKMDYVIDQFLGSYVISLKGMDWIMLGEEDYYSASVCGK